MAPRAYWKGYLKLSLVSCPIALYPASSSSERVSFNRINKKTGNRLKQLNVDAETGEQVEREDIGRGYEVGKGEYLQVEDEEIEKIQIESTHTIDIDSFVPKSEIDNRYLDSPYYIAPTDKVGQEAFAVIRDAIRDKGMVALGPRGARAPRARRDAGGVRQGPAGDDAALSLRGSRADRLFRGHSRLKLPKEMKELAAHIVDSKATHFDPDDVRGPLRDRAGRAAARQAGRPRHRGAEAAAEPARHQSDGCAAREHRLRIEEEARRRQHQSA